MRRQRPRVRRQRLRGAITAFYGVLKLKKMQTTYDAQSAPKPQK